MQNTRQKKEKPSEKKSNGKEYKGNNLFLKLKSPIDNRTRVTLLLLNYVNKRNLMRPRTVFLVRSEEVVNVISLKSLVSSAKHEREHVNVFKVALH